MKFNERADTLSRACSKIHKTIESGGGDTLRLGCRARRAVDGTYLG
jgi:hypothetical protein